MSFKRSKSSCCYFRPSQSVVVGTCIPFYFLLLIAEKNKQFTQRIDKQHIDKDGDIAFNIHCLLTNGGIGLFHRGIHNINTIERQPRAQYLKSWGEGTILVCAKQNDIT